VNQREIRRLADLLREYGLTEVEVEREGVRVRLRREVPPVAAAPAGPVLSLPASPAVASPAAAVAPGASEAHLLTIEAPMVGTFYRATNPETAPFVSEGDTIKEGQTLCIIEAMKLMNEIESKFTGRVVKIFVENAQPVEFGQPLFLVECRK